MHEPNFKTFLVLVAASFFLLFTFIVAIGTGAATVHYLFPNLF